MSTPGCALQAAHVDSRRHAARRRRRQHQHRRSGCSTRRAARPAPTGACETRTAAPATSTPRSCASCSARRARPRDGQAAAVSSVVPPMLVARRAAVPAPLRLRAAGRRPGAKTGCPILYENPREVGADRIVNAVAAYERWPQGCIVVDFGTATTFDCVTRKGEYLGGVIAPGHHHRGRRALPRRRQAAARRDRPPAAVVGRNTVHSMQSGLVFGYVGLVDAIVERMRARGRLPAARSSPPAGWRR